MTKALAAIMYANVVSKETVRLALMIAALSDLDIKLGNNLNVYVHSSV